MYVVSPECQFLYEVMRNTLSKARVVESMSTAHVSSLVKKPFIGSKPLAHSLVALNAAKAARLALAIKSPESEAHPMTTKSTAIENDILKHRHLVELHKVKNPMKTVSVSSYNILSRHYLWETLYNYLPHEYTNWNKRLERLDRSFRDLSKLSDIMCFQEMEYKYYTDYWKSYMKSMNFDSVFEKKPTPGYWKKSPNMMDGVSIFWNTDKFDLLNFEKINFSDYFKNSVNFEQTLDTKQRLNIRNTVAVIAILRHKYTNETIFVSNTHLYWSPKHDDVKLMQTYLLTQLLRHSIARHYRLSVSQVSEMIKQKNGPTIIMAGDFNSNPSSMVYKFMADGLIDRQNVPPTFDQYYGEKFQDQIQNCLGSFKSPYKDLYNKGLFKKTTYTPKFKDVIDYIWFGDCNEKFSFTKVLGDIDQEYLKDYQGFPNKEFPSDHIPILSQFEFK
ncbi:uncharacterized protein C5L36_0B10310 [Pichia kudriavzevii]|uniref:Endonuclease/exonuclease/phosphatase domain-containing protein n=1 Tax=Pichia kudriavzevii TaxID=4909 RepID=A0A2U9R3S1_PICKU|nr:uncharacterized protein C5L36_0B10310 [Pichia kudriavzevii]AWU75796.1 hypothetical protein C5L36_0B10310 [Pichia kudriavzevii]